MLAVVPLLAQQEVVARSRRSPCRRTDRHRALSDDANQWPAVPVNPGSRRDTKECPLRPVRHRPTTRAARRLGSRHPLWSEMIGLARGQFDGSGMSDPVSRTHCRCRKACGQRNRGAAERNPWHPCSSRAGGPGADRGASRAARERNRRKRPRQPATLRSQ